MIKLEGYMDMVQMRRDGISISEISRTIGHDRKTVRKYLREGFPVERSPRKQRTSKLDPFKDYLLKRILVDKVWNASVLLTEIREQGYEGQGTILRVFVKPLRDRERQLAVYRRIITDPGVQFQVDWGHFLFHGEVIYCFCAVLSHSGYRYIHFFPHQALEHFLEGHLLFFEKVGFIPREGLYDNLKSVILKRIKKGKVMNSRFLAFSCYMGFYPRVCLPYSPTSKGKVESLIGYVRKNFWVRYGNSCSDLSELNRAADLWLHQVNDRVHGTTGRRPALVIEEERREGVALWEEVRTYHNVYRSYRKVFKDATLSYGGIRYSVPYIYAKQVVEVQEPLCGGKICVYLQGDLIAEHGKPQGPEKLIIDPSHYRGMPIKARILRSVPEPTEGELLPPGPGLGLERRAPVVEERPLSEYERVFWEVTS